MAELLVAGVVRRTLFARPPLAQPCDAPAAHANRPVTSRAAARSSRDGPVQPDGEPTLLPREIDEPALRVRRQEHDAHPVALREPAPAAHQAPLHVVARRDRPDPGGLLADPGDL